MCLHVRSSRIASCYDRKSSTSNNENICTHKEYHHTRWYFGDLPLLQVMPLLPWDDGSLKYIHVDVHRLERYISSLDTFIVDCMLDRLGWMLSGSRVPFGILMERRVLVLLDCSCSVMGELLALQQHLRMLLREQLAHVQDFNLVR